MPSSKSDDQSHKHNQKTGQNYETLAALYFEQHGFTVLEKNWRASRKEVDLIVADEATLIFVEVKASNTEAFGHPSERVTKQKRENLTEAAERYLMEKKISGKDVRFDVVTFVKGKLEHYPNAFDLSD